MFAEIKARAQVEIDALKADARTIEERIDDAFRLGAMHHALAAAEAKIRADFGILDNKS